MRHFYSCGVCVGVGVFAPSLHVCRLAQALVLGFGKCELLDLRDNSAVSRVFVYACVCVCLLFDVDSN